MSETPREFLARWLPSGFLRGSAAFQVIGGVTAVASDVPSFLPALLLANHAVITAACLWPVSPLLGPNRVRLDAGAAGRREVALTFDDGPDPEVTPWVLDYLDRHGAKATFFLIAARARRYPSLTAEIAARGHTVGNHSFHHRVNFALQGVSALRRELADAQSALADLTGAVPRHFRAPAGMRNPWLQPMLTPLGLELVSWTRRGLDGVWKQPDRVYERLVRNLEAGDILLLHDGATAVGSALPLVQSVLPRLFERLDELSLKSAAL